MNLDFDALEATSSRIDSDGVEGHLHDVELLVGNFGHPGAVGVSCADFSQSRVISMTFYKKNNNKIANPQAFIFDPALHNSLFVPVSGLKPHEEQYADLR